MYNKTNKMARQLSITDPFAENMSNKKGVALDTKNGVTPAIICSAIKSLMKSSGSEFYEMTGEELVKKINLMTSCSRMCFRSNNSSGTLAIA